MSHIWLTLDDNSITYNKFNVRVAAYVSGIHRHEPTARIMIKRK